MSSDLWMCLRITNGITAGYHSVSPLCMPTCTVHI